MPRSDARLARDERGVARCFWCIGDPLYIDYHDREWGFPLRDDTRLFEKICLEGFQCGLSWLTILRKRENFRAAFAGFTIDAVARFTKRDANRLVTDAGIVRHRGKIESAINNARRAIELIEECGSLARFVWGFEPPAKERPRRVTWEWVMGHPVSPQSKALSRELRRRGWTYVGPTTMYAFMQAVGVVNDHLTGCAARERAEAARAAALR
jgi:DNA-3-methyladenine glycosylase I